MALIECNECGTQVSDKASKCPKCGNPMKAGKEKTKKIINKIIGVVCLLAAIAILIIIYIDEIELIRTHIHGVNYDRYYTITDYSDAYVKGYVKMVPLVLLIIGAIVLLLIAKIKLLPRIKSLYFTLVTAFILIISCFIQYDKEKTEDERMLMRYKSQQMLAMSASDFEQKEAEVPKVEAGKELLAQELKGCYSSNIRLLDMPDSLITGYCNELNKLSIKTWNTPLNGLDLKVYQAIYENEYGNRTTDRFYVFFKEDKPIKYAKEDFIREGSELKMLFLMKHNFE